MQWVCKTCGKVFSAPPKSNGKPRLFCSKSCEGQFVRSQKMFGVAYNDVPNAIKEHRTAYIKWRGMLERCYDNDYQSKHPTYRGCSVCEDWLVFSNFLNWFNSNYIEGYHLDKDIIEQGNRVYSPDTCCFVPQEINKLLTNRGRARGECVIGVRKKNGKFHARCQNNTKDSLFIGAFDTEESAFQAYKRFKEGYIHLVADKYLRQGLIDERVHKSLCNYKISK